MEGIQNTFCHGAIFGFAVAGVIGWIFRQIQAANVRMRQLNRPLDAFPDAAQPRLTPAGIFWNGIKGMFACGFWFIILIIIIFVIARITQNIMNQAL